MTEAEDDLKDAFDFCLDLYYRQDQHTPMYGVILDCLDELKQYRALGTIEELREAMEKQIAKKPIVRGLGQRYCSVCGCGGADHQYCGRCGQKLDSEV